MNKYKSKVISKTAIKQIKRLLDGYRLQHGYKIVKRKRKPKKYRYLRIF